MIKYVDQNKDRQLLSALAALRASPAGAIFQQSLVDELEQVKTSLVFNQTQVPSLQGRAQALLDVIELLNRKP